MSEGEADVPEAAQRERYKQQWDGQHVIYFEAAGRQFVLAQDPIDGQTGEIRLTDRSASTTVTIPPDELIQKLIDLFSEFGINPSEN